MSNIMKTTFTEEQISISKLAKDMPTIWLKGDYGQDMIFTDFKIEVGNHIIGCDFEVKFSMERDNGDYFTPPSATIKSISTEFSRIDVWVNGEDNVLLSKSDKSKLELAITKNIEI